MGEGIRGINIAGLGTLVLCLLFLHNFEVVNAAIYNVGDDLGWTFNVSSWPTGKTFHVGDILAFNYSRLAHNVVVVDKVGYNWCIVNPIDATVHNSGNDEIKLLNATNYFICSFPGHCQMGVKLSISTT